MHLSDVINACFEGFASIAVLNHCRTILKDRQVRGTSILSTVFFTSWGFWNVYYYPSLGQLFSAVAGCTICLANCFYVYLLIKFRETPITNFVVTHVDIEKKIITIGKETK